MAFEAAEAFAAPGVALPDLEWQVLAAGWCLVQRAAVLRSGIAVWGVERVVVLEASVGVLSPASERPPQASAALHLGWF